MRIVWVLKKELDVAGDRSARLGMMAALRNAGHEVLLITGYRDVPNDYGLGSAIRYVSALRTKGLKHLSFVANATVDVLDLVAKHGADAVILDTATAPLLAPLLRLQSEVGTTTDRPAVVIDVRTMPVHASGAKLIAGRTLFGWGLTVGARYADGVSAITVPMLEHLQRQYALPAGLPLGVWMSGVDLGIFSPQEADPAEVESIRRDLDLDGRISFIHHGTVASSRGLADAIDGVAMLSPSSRKRIVLVVV
jgi:hypothetical protein